MAAWAWVTNGRNGRRVGDCGKENGRETMSQEHFDKFVAAAVKMLDVEADKVTREATFKEDLDADSLDLVEFVMELEEVFGVEMPEDEYQELKTVGEAFDLLMTKV